MIYSLREFIENILLESLHPELHAIVTQPSKRGTSIQTDYDVLKTFLLFLNLLPKVIMKIKGNDINTNVILLDWNVVKILRTI